MKHLILIQIRGKLKSFNCNIESGKLCFDFKNNITLICDEKEKIIRKQNSIEPKVKQVFLPLIEKKKKTKVDVFAMLFNFANKELKFQAYFEDGTMEEKNI
jgi:hypothetical protein